MDGSGTSPAPMILRAVIFDLDGTLIDSAPDIAAALNTALEGAGHVPLPLDRVKGFVGGGARLLIERGLTACGETPDGARIGAVYEQFLAAYAADPVRHTALYPGALSTLQTLASQGVQLGVCTNKPAALTTAILDKLALAPFFGSVSAADGSLPLKPAPEMLRKTLQDLAVTAAEAVMVGDSAADAGAAQAAGMRSVLLTHGYSHGPLANLGADAVLSGFDGLLAWLQQLDQRTIARA